MKILKTDIDKLKKYRAEYFKSMPEFQELFIEILVKEYLCYSVNIRKVDAGYVIITNDGVLIEFYLEKEYINDSRFYFDKIVEELKVREVYCKSFDSLLLSCCLLSSYPYSVYGILYRDYIRPHVEKDPVIEMEKADISLSGFIMSQDSSIKELFENEMQLYDFIQNDNVFLFYKYDEFVGCGMMVRTHDGWNYCDLCIWVVPSARGQSLGSQILLRLKDFAEANRIIPTCGCAADNYASQKAIEKSGFASRYKLIRFCVKLD